MAMNNVKINETYVSLAGAIPEGVSKGEALKAACILVGDILEQISGKKFDYSIYEATVGIIKIEYQKFIEK